MGGPDQPPKKRTTAMAELKSEITQNTQRIGYLYMDVSKVIENLNRALSKKEMIDDILVRI